ncbi:MAG TPA: class F sortase [Pseudonocardia sp.]|nr:class F sortase [Pseudonocardia sp.]
MTPASVEIAGAEPAPVGLAAVTDDGALNVPPEIDRLGWWVGSKPMGATAGTTLIAGHVDSAVAGLGYFAKLTELAEGDPITVTDGLGEEWEFEVSDTVQVTKSALPEDLFDTTGERRLALITCGGEFDPATGSYTDNFIVYATPA